MKIYTKNPSFTTLQASYDIKNGRQNWRGIAIAESLDDMAGRSEYKSWSPATVDDPVGGDLQLLTAYSKKLDIY